MLVGTDIFNFDFEIIFFLKKIFSSMHSAFVHMGSYATDSGINYASSHTSEATV